jgi:hypothetical protein
VKLENGVESIRKAVLDTDEATSDNQGKKRDGDRNRERERERMNRN